MIIDITNQLFTEIKNTIKECTILSSYQNVIPSFPTIIFEEINNTSYKSTKDSSGYNHSLISFKVEIYTKGNGKAYQSKKIRDKVDKVLSDKYGLNRDESKSIPNYLDENIHRHIMIYSGIIDKNKTIYGR